MDIHRRRGGSRRNVPLSVCRNSRPPSRPAHPAVIARRALIERPEYKRRWQGRPWEEQERDALQDWLLDRLEDPRYWGAPAIRSVNQLAERARIDADFLSVAALYISARARHPERDKQAIETFKKTSPKKTFPAEWRRS